MYSLVKHVNAICYNQLNTHVYKYRRSFSNKLPRAEAFRNNDIPSPSSHFYRRCI